MFVGTCSDAGKSVINAAFCRIFLQDGYSPAPFKAQNMSLNSYSTREGGEMGRAQVVQAEACRVSPHTDMNPVLLKPTHDCSSQVILNGKAIGNMSAKDYFGNENPKDALFAEVVKSFHRLAEQYSPIVLEGAGSISELNLKDRDITNMRMAMAAGAATYLVADIDRGGVFGSVYGTIMLLTPEEKACMKGVIINKFRGDLSLFDDGRRMLEELTGIPVVAVIPYFRDIKIEEEDSVSLGMKRNNFKSGVLNVAIVLLPHMSNFTDFDVLEMDKRFNTYYTASPEDTQNADIILLPGSKNTIEDLQYLHNSGTAAAIIAAHKRGKRVVGVCGGYQMMGQRIDDPFDMESNLKSINGLGLLPQYTVITEEKTTIQRNFHFVAPGKEHALSDSNLTCKGYEIHMGETTMMEGAEAQPVALLDNGKHDGHIKDRDCWGTYLHGFLDNSEVLDFLAEGLTSEDTASESFDYEAFKDSQYDKLADLVRSCSDMETIYRSLQ